MSEMLFGEFAIATIEPAGKHITVRWNKLENVSQYNVQVWCNHVCERTEIVSEPFFSDGIRRGRRFQFIISPYVHDVGGSKQQQFMKSNAVYTIPSKVTGICITESNGLRLTWRKMDGEVVKYFIRVTDRNSRDIDEVKGVASTTYEWEYKKLNPGTTYIFEISSRCGPEASKATIESYTYEGRLEVSCRIYMKSDCIRILHALTGIDASEQTQKLENEGYEQLELKCGAYSLMRVESTATTTVESEATVTPHENMVTYENLWHDGWCIEQYLFSDMKRGAYASTYTISWHGCITKIPFIFVYLEQSRSTENLQQSGASDIDSIFAGAAGRETSSQSSSESENPGEVRSSFVQFRNAGSVHVYANSPNVGGIHETYHTPPQHQDAAKNTEVYHKESDVASDPNYLDEEQKELPIKAAQDKALENLSHLGAYGGDPVRMKLRKENGNTDFNEQQKLPSEKAAQKITDEPKGSRPLLLPRPAARTKSVSTPRGSSSRQATDVLPNSSKNVPK